MVINALNANVKVFMADFEDSLAPDWNKVIDGQINLRDAVNGTISYTNEQAKLPAQSPISGFDLSGTRSALAGKNMSRRGVAIPGSLFDFALYFFHNYQALLARAAVLFLSAETQSGGKRPVERSLQLCRRSL